MTKYFIIIFLLTYGFSSCKPDVKERVKSDTHNYIVLLDLSDRIINEGQLMRDIELVGQLYEMFLKKLQSEFFFSSTDKFKVVIPYQKDALPSSRITMIEDSLYINVEEIDVSKRKDLKGSKSNVVALLQQLYAEANISDNDDDYKGADIYGWIQNDLELNLVLGPKCENHLFILTDGYMYAEGKTKGLDNWSSVRDLSNVNVHLLELDPNKNIVGEQDRMINTWKNWFEKMNVKTFSSNTTSSISKIIEDLEKEVLVKNNISLVPVNSESKETRIKKNQNNISVKELDSKSTESLRTGNYYSISNAKVRTLSINNISPSTNGFNLKCSLIPMGESYGQLNGSFSTSERRLQIEKLGIFDVITTKESIILKGIKSAQEYTLLLND